MKVVYEAYPRRFIVQGNRGDDWQDEIGFATRDDAIEEAERLQGLFPTERYRVVDTEA